MFRKASGLPDVFFFCRVSLSHVTPRHTAALRSKASVPRHTMPLMSQRRPFRGKGVHKHYKARVFTNKPVDALVSPRARHRHDVVQEHPRRACHADVLHSEASVPTSPHVTPPSHRGARVSINIIRRASPLACPWMPLCRPGLAIGMTKAGASSPRPSHLVAIGMT